MASQESPLTDALAKGNVTAAISILSAAHHTSVAKPHELMRGVPPSLLESLPTVHMIALAMHHTLGTRAEWVEFRAAPTYSSVHTWVKLTNAIVGDNVNSDRVSPNVHLEEDKYDSGIVTIMGALNALERINIFDAVDRAKSILVLWPWQSICGWIICNTDAVPIIDFLWSKGLESVAKIIYPILKAELPEEFATTERSAVWMAERGDSCMDAEHLKQFFAMINGAEEGQVVDRDMHEIDCALTLTREQIMKVLALPPAHHRAAAERIVRDIYPSTPVPILSLVHAAVETVGNCRIVERFDNHPETVVTLMFPPPAARVVHFVCFERPGTQCTFLYTHDAKKRFRCHMGRAEEVIPEVMENIAQRKDVFGELFDA